MALFGNSEEKATEKTEKLMKKYHLENLNSYQAEVKEIANDLAGNKAIELGTLLQGGSADSAKLSYLSAIMKQNWIIIRLLDQIANK